MAMDLAIIHQFCLAFEDDIFKIAAICGIRTDPVATDLAATRQLCLVFEDDII